MKVGGGPRNGKTLNLSSGKKKGPVTHANLDADLETYFLRNGQSEAVKQHLDDDLEAFMKKAKDI